MAQTPQGREIPLQASIGVSLYPQDGPNAEALIGSADVAMYRAKQLGGDGNVVIAAAAQVDRAEPTSSGPSCPVPTCTAPSSMGPGCAAAGWPARPGRPTRPSASGTPRSGSTSRSPRSSMTPRPEASCNAKGRPGARAGRWLREVDDRVDPEVAVRADDVSGAELDAGGLLIGALLDLAQK